MEVKTINYRLHPIHVRAYRMMMMMMMMFFFWGGGGGGVNQEKSGTKCLKDRWISDCFRVNSKPREDNGPEVISAAVLQCNL